MTPQEEQFLQAAKNGDMEIIKNYLSEMSMELKNKAFIYTPSVPIARFLKETNADITGIDKGDFHCSVSHHKWHYPALAVACKENYVQKAQWLIQTEVNLNEYWYDSKLVAGMSNVDDLYKFTPLMWAVKNKNLALIELLVKSGADVNLKGHEGWVGLKDCTALEIAEEYSYGDYIGIANLLKSAGAKE